MDWQGPSYVYIREPAGLSALTRSLAGAARVALDTEADSLHNYFEKVCLIQLSVQGEHYVVDPLARLDLNDLLEALAEKPLIVHGGDYDLRIMRASTGFRPRREVFDTMIAAQLLGLEEIGLAALVQRFFGTAIEKHGQKSDWSRRPLTEKQLSYASNDTRFLDDLADRLHAGLAELNRLDWHAQSCRAMVDSTGRDNTRDPEQAWRMKGSGRLTRRQLAYLRELWRWRDQLARRANRPPFKVLGNEQVLELLRWAESHPGASPREGAKLPRSIEGPKLESLERALRRAAAMPPESWPEPKPIERRDDSLMTDKEEIHRLRGECAGIAARLGIAPSTVASRASLEAIARHRPRSVDDIMKTGGLLRWQAELIQPAVERYLRSAEADDKTTG